MHEDWFDLHVLDGATESVGSCVSEQRLFTQTKVS